MSHESSTSTLAQASPEVRLAWRQYRRDVRRARAAEWLLEGSLAAVLTLGTVSAVISLTRL